MIKSIIPLIRNSSEAAFFTKFVARSAQLGIMLGLAALIVVMSVMNGFKAETIQKFLSSTPHIIMLPGPDAKIPKQIPNSIKLYPVEAASVYKGHFLPIKLVAAKNVNYGQVLVPKVLAERYKLINHQSMQIFAGKLNNMLGIPRNKAQEIKVVSVPVWRSSYISISFELARALDLLSSKTQPEINIFLKNPYNSDKIASEIAKNNQNWQVITWQSIHKDFFQLIATQKSMMFLVLFFMILLASFGLVSSQVMLVHEQRREIAILATIGMPEFNILLCYFVKGLIQGIIGLLLGLVLGLIIASNITIIVQYIEHVSGHVWLSNALYGMDHMPSKILAQDLFLITGYGLLLCAVTPFYPALLASRSDPIKIFQQDGAC